VVEVSQSARDAAGDFVRMLLASRHEISKSAFPYRTGELDGSPLVQAFAAAEQRGHARSDAERAALVAEVVERCAKVAENYHFWQGSSDLADGHTKEWIATAIRAALAPLTEPKRVREADE